MIYHYFVAYAHPTGVGRLGYTSNGPITTMAQVEQVEMMIEITHSYPYNTVTLTRLPEILRIEREEDAEDGAPFDEPNEWGKE